MIKSSKVSSYGVAAIGLSWGITQWIPFAMIREGVTRYQINPGASLEEDVGTRTAYQAGIQTWEQTRA